jgi:hypothetical protein
MIWNQVSTVSSRTHIHTHKIQTYQNIPEISELFIEQYSRTHERAIESEGALSFHAVEHFH